MKVTIVFVVMLALSSASLRPLGSKQKQAALLEMDSRPIGNMIMSQLQIHLASEGVVDDVVSLVAGLIAELNTEQENADRQHNQDVVQCESQLSSTQAKHQQHDQSAQQCDDTKQSTEELLDRSNTELAEAIENIKNLGLMIEDGTKLRAKQATAYDRSMAKHQAGIDALTEAIKIIGAFHSGGSWVQLQTKVEKVTTDLQNLQHLKEFDTYGPIIQSLVEMTSTTEADAVQEILKLLKMLRKNIEMAVNEETASENQRIDAWNRELSTMTTQRNRATDRKGVLETNIDNYRTIIKDNIKSSKMHREEEQRFIELNKNWQLDCDGRFAAYDQSTADRQADLEVLNRLQEYLVEQVGALEDYLMERVN